MRRLLTVPALALLCVGGVAEPLPARSAGLEAQADAILRAAYPADGPGAAVVIMRGGRTVYASARGLADMQTRRPITNESVFQIGSVTKQFTAAAVLQLVQAGEVSLDDPVARFLPDYTQPAATATVRQLLNHSSGITSFDQVPGWFVAANTSRAYSTAQLIEVFKNLPLTSPPGQAWSYSNSNYVLLGAVLESVTRRPWHAAVQSRIAAPLRLRTIGYAGSRKASRARVLGYTRSADGAIAPARRTDPSVQHAAAGLVGSAGDVARWTYALHHGRVLGPPLYTQMITPTTLAGGRAHPYGFGVAFGDVRGRRAIRHDGRISGFNSESIYVPAGDIVVVILTNNDSAAVPPAQVGRRLAGLALGEPYRSFVRVHLEAAALAPLMGIYRPAGAGAGRQLLARDGKVYMARDGAPAREVFAASADHFFFPDTFTWFRIERHPQGRHVMHLHQDDAPVAERLSRSEDASQAALPPRDAPRPPA